MRHNPDHTVTLQWGDLLNTTVKRRTRRANAVANLKRGTDPRRRHANPKTFSVPAGTVANLKKYGGQHR